jgi:23S rRNA (cytidine1920-2'-O)/16S rRNA (cytidine1409-2'-O)-methyltransferase
LRLDLVLVRRGCFSSRQKAKESIKRGLVRVEGKIITKPSFDVEFGAEIEVLFEERPKGYWKLKEIDESLEIFRGDEIVLDLGSSAGGFLLYSSEKARFVYGIEFSREFESELRRIEKEKKNVKVFIGDAFIFDISILPHFDLILNDLTLPFSSSMKALKRFLPKLKDNGKVLFVHKLGDDEAPEFKDFEILKEMISKEKKEKYYLLRKRI